jgi:hypothetical protein
MRGEVEVEVDMAEETVSISSGSVDEKKLNL